MPRPTEFDCRVCNQVGPRESMRKSSKGRTMHHCLRCVGFYRCVHCDEVKTSDRFKTHSGRRKFFFDDGEPIRIAVCYGCDYKLNKHRYARYDKRVQSTETLRAIMLNNIQRWRSKTTEAGHVFDLDYEFLTNLWEQQQGQCPYTGAEIALTRGMGQWNSASLDRIDPDGGYVRGNVVWTTRLVNTSKGQRTAAEFFEFCKGVAEHQESFLSAHALSTSP